MKYLKPVLLVIIIIVLQVSVVEQFINTQFYINLPLLIIIYYSWMLPTTKTYLLTIGMGWGISYFDALPFGITIILFLITSIVVQRVSLTYLTNKTLGSLIIAGFTGTLLFTLLLTLVSLGQYGIDITFVQAYILPKWTIFINILISSLLLVLLKFSMVHHEISQT